jgi:hypothetical protein
MIQKLPYLPDKPSMSKKSHISLKPRFYITTTSPAFRVDTTTTEGVDVYPLNMESCKLALTHSPIHKLLINNLKKEMHPKSIEKASRNFILEEKVTMTPRKNHWSYHSQRNTCIGDSFRPCVETDALPYLPSFDMLSRDTSKTCFYLVPRTKYDEKNFGFSRHSYCI